MGLVPRRAGRCERNHCHHAKIAGKENARATRGHGITQLSILMPLWRMMSP
jgi:hypothetical protein